MKEGLILEFFINNQKKSKKQIANDLGMARTNLYEFFSSATLKDETKEKFEKYFGTEIFSGENKRLAEQAWHEQETTHAIVRKGIELSMKTKEEMEQQASLQHENIGLKKENNHLKKENAELLKKIIELQDKLIEAMKGSAKNERPKVNE